MQLQIGQACPLPSRPVRFPRMNQRYLGKRGDPRCGSYCVIVTPLRLRIATTLVPPSINRPKSSFRPEGGFPKMMSWSGFASENGLLEVTVTDLFAVS